jgi:chorismate mutase-like protein
MWRLPIVYPSGDAEQTSQLDPLAKRVVQRLALSQEVATAKYAARQSVDDPVREQQVLLAVARVLRRTGTRRNAGLQFARDQIEANRVIQRGLLQRWGTHPEEVPGLCRDLTTQVWPDLDLVTAQLMRRFKDLADLPRLRRESVEEIIDRHLAATIPAPPLPGLYRHATLFALRLFCLDCR